MELPTKYLETADVIAVFVGEKHAIELLGFDPAKFEPNNQLPRAQAAVDEQPAMIGGDEGGVTGTAAPEHRQTEHRRTNSEPARRSQIEMRFPTAKDRQRAFCLAVERADVQHRAMKLFLPFVVLVVFALVQPTGVRADEASHRKSAETLLGLMNMETLMTQTVDQMLEMQVKQNPAIAPYQAEMKAFFNKYMSWASMKDEMVKLYTTEFSEAELKELTTFYQSPIGKKTLQKMPALMAKGAEIGQRRVQEHLPELQASIQAKAGAAKK